MKPSRAGTRRALVLVLLIAGCWSLTAIAPAGAGVNVPANISVGNDLNQAGAVVTYPAPVPTAPDTLVNCDIASGTFFPLGPTTITCTTNVTATIGTFTVTVLDTQPPTITAPANQTVQNALNQAGNFVTFPAPISSDNAPGVTAGCLPSSGSFFPIGINIVTCTATDAAGNTATATFTVTVTGGNSEPASGAAPPPVVAVVATPLLTG